MSLPMLPREALPACGSPLGGGHFVGLYRIDGLLYALVVAAHGEKELGEDYGDADPAVPAAASRIDGHANTLAMAAAGHPLAQAILALGTAGFSDWYLPALDELDLCYLHLKPDRHLNHIDHLDPEAPANPIAEPPVGPRTPGFPTQTHCPAFRENHGEAFNSADWYWSSTHAERGHFWLQSFHDGEQTWGMQSDYAPARPVRRLRVRE